MLLRDNIMENVFAPINVLNTGKIHHLAMGNHLRTPPFGIFFNGETLGN